MENLNSEQIVIEIQGLIKALKANNGWWENRGRGGWFNHDILVDAVAVITSQEHRIKELTEENERLRAENELLLNIKNLNLDKVIADTVRKMQTAIKEYYSKSCYRPTKEHPVKHTQIEHLFYIVDAIAKEIEEEGK